MTEWREARCPICGRTITSQGRMIKHFEKIPHYDPDKNFGRVMESFGRGTMRVVREFNPGEEEEGDKLFEVIKERLLQAIREWMEKGWIKEEDLIEK